MRLNRINQVLSLFVLLLSVYFGFSDIKIVHKTVDVIIIAYLSFVLVKTMFFFFGTYREKMNEVLRSKLDKTKIEKPMVSIIVPAFNEEKGIAIALKSLFQLNYHNYEIIFVDDGSSDDTFSIASYISSLYPHVNFIAIHQQNAGKSAALNHGIHQASGHLILCVDADSRLTPDSLLNGIKHFQDPSVGAVAGFVHIANQINPITQLQQLEYLVGLNFTRKALSFLGIVPIVPGPAGMFRKDILLEVGGFSTKKNNFAEDAELSLRILSKGWKVHSEEHMVAVTEAPEDIKSLLRQRYRWGRGTYQAISNNFKRLWDTPRLQVKLLATYLFGETVITPHINLSLIIYLMSYYIHSGHLQAFTIWYFYLLALDFLTSIVVTYNQKGVLKWMALTLINKFFYYYTLLTWHIICLHEEWSEKEMEWDKLERKGHFAEGEAI